VSNNAEIIRNRYRYYLSCGRQKGRREKYIGGFAPYAPTSFFVLDTKNGSKKNQPACLAGPLISIVLLYLKFLQGNTCGIFFAD
jgi:hypothetical protein